MCFDGSSNQCSMGICPSRWGAHSLCYSCTQDKGTHGETFPHFPLLGKLRETFPQCGGHVSPKGVLVGISLKKG